MAEYRHCPQTTLGMGVGGGTLLSPYCCYSVRFPALGGSKSLLGVGELSPQWNRGTLELLLLLSEQNYILYPCSDAQESIISTFHMFYFFKRQPAGVDDLSEPFLMLLAGV